MSQQYTKARWVKCETCNGAGLKCKDCDGKGSFLYGEGEEWTALYKLQGALEFLELVKSNCQNKE